MTRMSALLYLLSPLVLLATGAGFYVGGAWCLTGAVLFVALAVVDELLPRDFSDHRIGAAGAWQALFYAHYLFIGVTWLALALSMGAGRIEGWWLVPAWVSLVLVGGGIGLPASHELMHGKTLASRVGADLVGTLVGIPMTELAHVNVHHLHVGTARDGDTPRRGEGIYRFGLVSIWKQLTESLAIENARQRRFGRSILSPRGRLLWGVLAQIAFGVAFCVLAGWWGIPMLITAWLAMYVVMADYNYVQHYGIVRVPGTPIEKRHAWNHLRPLSRRLTFEITTHSEHHLDPDCPYHRLTPMREAPQLPGVWWCFLVSFVPPLWHRMMRTHLARWDREHATAAERALAAQANAAAGWPAGQGAPAGA